MAEMSWIYWLTFDGLSAAERVTTPTVFIHGDECVLPDHVKLIHNRLNAKKKLVWVSGQQADFYDQKPLVDRAIGEATSWFTETLL